MTIRTRFGLANTADVQKAIGNDLSAFAAKFPDYSNHERPDAPGFAVPCSYVYSWFGQQNVKVAYSDGVITLNPVDAVSDIQ